MVHCCALHSEAVHCIVHFHSLLFSTVRLCTAQCAHCADEQSPSFPLWEEFPPKAALSALTLTLKRSYRFSYHHHDDNDAHADGHDLYGWQCDVYFFNEDFINQTCSQVSGDVYAVDENTLLLQNFVYDGNGRDAFFWAGSSSRPNSKGFIVPDKTGKTNVLDRYHNEEFTIELPLQKKITDLKWFSVYDLTSQSNFGDIYIREGFEPPGYRTLTDIPGTSNSVKSAAVVVMDSKTVKIPAFTYDGLGGQVFFTAGEGPQPSSKGFVLPDELGYLAPLGRCCH